MLDGSPPNQWIWSVVLRRTLYPLISFPFMKWLGFEYGGILVNFLLAVIAVVGFATYLRRRVGPRGALAATWLLATYPGLHYWIGLPYCNAIIVPISLAAAAALWQLQDESRLWAITLLSLALGMVYLGHDVAIIFAPAALGLVCVRTRRLGPVVLSLVVQGTPTAVNALVESYWLKIPLRNINSEMYIIVLQSYLHPGNPIAWGRLLLKAPYILVENFFASSFGWLPLLFAGLWVVTRRQGWTWLERFELAILLGALAPWALNNLAPPYYWRWMMRGEWIARIYEPIFVVFLTFIARVVENAAHEAGQARRLFAAIAVTVALNTLVMVGPFVGATAYTGFLYWTFYRHAPNYYATVNNVARFGRRPIAFCGR
jgi:hypothetical protein